MTKGHLHPLSQFIRKTAAVFQKLGFEIIEGNEVETEWYNFDALRMFSDHPARDVQDTFWLKDGRVLRTHTSAMQVRAMETRKPPVRLIIPGRCFRHEATDSSHEATFYQLEGFAIDKNIKMTDLLDTLDYFLKEVFGQKIKTRFYPHYYPFVEPGMDVHIKNVKAQMSNVKTDKWLEVLGSGMIHPDVLKNMKIDPKKWTGFAFGMGIDRLMMLYYEINDIRLSYSGDLRFLKQF